MPPTTEETKLNLEQVQKTLDDFGKELQEKLKSKMEEHKSEYNGEVKKATEDLVKVNQALTNVQQQIKGLEAGSLPGLAQEKEKFSLQSYVRSLYMLANPNESSERAWDHAGFEKDVVESYQKVFAKQMHELNLPYEEKANIAGDGTAGGYLIPAEVSSEIIGLTIAAIPLLNKLPVTKNIGLIGDFRIPKVTGRPTGYWVGENTKPTESQAAYGEVISRPRRAAGFTKQSKRLVYQSRGVSDTIIKQLLIEALSLVIHQGLISGTGSNYQPLGLAQSSWTTQFTSNTINLGTNGGRFTIVDAFNMQVALDSANERTAPPANFGYLLRPEVLGGLKSQTVAQYSGQSKTLGAPVVAGMPLITDTQLEGMLGMMATTTQLSAALTKGSGTTLSRVVYANWKLFWINFWRNFSLRVSDQAGDGSTGSAFLDDQFYLVADQEIDCVWTRPSGATQVNHAETNQANF